MRTRLVVLAAVAAVAVAAGAVSSADATGGAAANAGDHRSASAAAEGGILFVRSGEIFVRLDDGTIRRLTRNRVGDAFPTWSPDRTEIAFVRTRRGNADIYVMAADGSNVRRLTGGRRAGGGGNDLYPAWSPDGELIAFASDRGRREREIYVMGRDGTNVRRLTRTADHVDDSQPRFSPDGRFLVFTSNRIAYWNYEIFRVRVSDGRGLRRLTFWGSGRDGAPGDDLLPAYSPDGSRIAFVSDRRAGYAIWAMDAATGRNLREVVRHRGLNHAFPRFSPDGTRIVYSTFAPDGDGTDARLWTVGSDGSGRTRLGRGDMPDW